MHILIVKLSAIGDVIHSLAVLDALRKLFPDAHITWLVEEAAADLLVGHPQLDRVLIMTRKSWLREVRSPQRWAACLGALHRGLRTLRDTRYDLVVDLQAALKASLPLTLARTGRIVGHDRADEGSHFFLTERVPAFDRDRHAVLRYLDLAHYLGAPENPPAFVVPRDGAVAERAAECLREAGIEAGRPWLAINPVATWPTKLWPSERLARLADRLIAELGLQVVLTGGAGDTPVIEAIRAAMRERAGSLAGRTGLRDLAEIYRQARCLVTTDTGPMHLAAAVGTRVVALFGPTAPWRTGPFGRGHRVIRHSLACSPCFRRKCATIACMREITVDRVFQEVSQCLSES